MCSNIQEWTPHIYTLWLDYNKILSQIENIYIYIYIVDVSSIIFIIISVCKYFVVFAWKKKL